MSGGPPAVSYTVANPDHLAILRQGVDAWKEWRTSNPHIEPDLRDISLPEANLSGFDLSGAGMRRADFRCARFDNCNLAGADLRDAVLRGADLSGVGGLLQPEQLAGADLAGAKLPDSLTDLFKHLDVAKKISENAQKLFVAMLAACLYSWLTIATTTDAGLVTNRASSPLPIIQTSIPIVGFYVVTPLLLLGVYFYFHLYLQKLWDEMGSLPAIFPDGRPLQAKADPWLLSDLVRSHVSKLSRDRPLMSYLQKWISILLAWCVVPITLALFWARYLPRHDMVWTTFHCVLTAIVATSAVLLYRLASATLGGAERHPFLWKSALQRLRAWQPAAIAVASGAALWIVSIGAVNGVRQGVPGRDWWPRAGGPRTWIPVAMNQIGYSPFADLRAADLSLKPANWTGKSDAELDSVKGLQLSAVDLRYADMRGAFLPGTVLTDAHLEWADLLLADLRQSELAGAHMEGTDLLGARLNGADLSGADLRKADLNGADLTGAELKYADLRDAKGLAPDALAKGNNWRDALYSSSVLQMLKLAEGNNDRVQRDRKAEDAGIQKNEAAAEIARVGQLSRLIPGATALMRTYRITHNTAGATEIATVDLPRMGPASSFTVAELARLYDFPAGVDGHGQAIAAIEFGGRYRDADLDAYFARAKVKKPNIYSVPVDGKKDSPGDPDDDAQVELDIEVAGTVAPGADIVVYFSDSTTKGWVDAIRAVTHDTTHRPSVLLIGWGAAEGSSDWAQAQMQQVNEQLHLAAKAGITVVVAAGDDGSKTQMTDGRAHANFPASSPWVLAVGGTRLRAAGNSIASEVVWNDGPGGATGGGVSDYFPRPDWQSQVQVPARANGKLGRGIPDVAANASALTGYQVLLNGQIAVVGGTSAVTPLWAGLIALLNQSLGRNIGYLNPVLYQRIGPAGVLHGIVSGDNSYGGVKGYSAGTGWNACTGWGTPDGKKLLEALRSAL
jgi:uncharacterized protein YjbI with pentapeptide repeats